MDLAEETLWCQKCDELTDHTLVDSKEGRKEIELSFQCSICGNLKQITVPIEPIKLIERNLYCKRCKESSQHVLVEQHHNMQTYRGDLRLIFECQECGERKDTFSKEEGS